MYTTAVQYGNEMVHSLRKTVDKQQQVMTLQEHLIDSKNDLVVSQKEWIVCNKEHTTIIQKYHSLKESILAKISTTFLPILGFSNKPKKPITMYLSNTKLLTVFM